jgi:hypothetical protein
MTRLPYEKPAIAGRQEFETQAMACHKTPGIGTSNCTPCGRVWLHKSGASVCGCYMNPQCRSS